MREINIKKSNNILDVNQPIDRVQHHIELLLYYNYSMDMNIISVMLISMGLALIVTGKQLNM